MFVRTRSDNKYSGVDKRIVTAVKRFARCMKQFKVFARIDIEDLEQDLMLEALSALRKGPVANIEHFLGKVLSRRKANLLRGSLRKKRHANSEVIEYSDELYYQQGADATCAGSTKQEQHIDLLRYIERLPIKQRVACYFFLADYSLPEISKISGMSQNALAYSLFQRNAVFPNDVSHPRCIFGVLNKMGMNISAIETLSVQELSNLKVYDLADLSEQVTMLLNYSKKLKEKMDAALDVRYSEVVRANLSLAKKDTGTTKFVENGFQITAEISKKVVWDSDKVREIIKEIPGGKAREIIKEVYSIDERKYSQLSQEEQRLFEKARTVIPGKTKFRFSAPEYLQPQGGGRNYNENYISGRTPERTNGSENGDLWSVWNWQDKPIKDIIRAYTMFRFRSRVISSTGLERGLNFCTNMG